MVFLLSSCTSTHFKSFIMRGLYCLSALFFSNVLKFFNTCIMSPTISLLLYLSVNPFKVITFASSSLYFLLSFKMSLNVTATFVNSIALRFPSSRQSSAALSFLSSSTLFISCSKSAFSLSIFSKKFFHIN